MRACARGFVGANARTSMNAGSNPGRLASYGFLADQVPDLLSVEVGGGKFG
jgi:hypothetical protein